MTPRRRTVQELRRDYVAAVENMRGLVGHPKPRRVLAAASRMAIARSAYDTAALAGRVADAADEVWQLHVDAHAANCWTRSFKRESYHANPLLCACFQERSPAMRQLLADGHVRLPSTDDDVEVAS